MVGKYLRKSSSVLRNNETICVESETTTEILRRKHPEPKSSLDLAPLPEDAPRFMMELGDFTKMLRRTFNGSTAGRSGLTGEHLKRLLDHDGAMTGLLEVFGLLVDGEFPGWCHPYITVSKLLGLGEKARPVCVMSWLCRTASKLAFYNVDKQDQVDHFMQTFAEGRIKVLQMANGVPGGAEAAVHLLDALIHSRDKVRALMCIDIKNAYNSTDRVRAVNRTMAQFPVIARWIRWLYCWCITAPTSCGARKGRTRATRRAASCTTRRCKRCW